jgi:polyhydroxybutyrate depolymerase
MTLASARFAAGTEGCTLAATNGTIDRTLGSRVYQLHVPQNLSGTQVPLLIGLHGAGGNGYVIEHHSGWSQFADANNFIVAYPDAPGYPAGNWDPYTLGSPDVAFVLDVVADIVGHWCIDPHLMYVEGWSSGAIMSQRVACDAADVFAAATSFVGLSPTAPGSSAPCQPARPISVGLIVGQLDPATSGSLTNNAAEWERYGSCLPSPTHESDGYGYSNTYSCAAGTQVMTRVVSNTAHYYPEGAQGEDQRIRVWSFFQSNQRARQRWAGSE